MQEFRIVYRSKYEDSRERTGIVTLFFELLPLSNQREKKKGGGGGSLLFVKSLPSGKTGIVLSNWTF